MIKRTILILEDDMLQRESLCRWMNEYAGRRSISLQILTAASIAEARAALVGHPPVFAFFLDNLLTTLQFSYTCDYYRKRFEIYTGIDVNKMDDEQVVSQLLSFIESAFTYEKKKQR